MAKLYFRYGTMGSSKTANALMVRHNYVSRDKTVALLKPAIECRDGEKVIRSRIGLCEECEFVEDFIDENESNLYGLSKYDAVIVDESQFLTETQVDFFAKIVDICDIPVICYGLSTDFQGHLFEGSKRLFEIADTLEEIPTICWCGKKAHFNARVLNGKVVKTGEQIEMGGDEKYTPLCRKHFLAGQLSKKKK